MRRASNLLAKVRLDKLDQIYSPDPRASLLPLVRQYEGHCLHNRFIVRIESIDYKSLSYACSTNDGAFTATVGYSAEYIQYNRGDIITDCKVTKIEDTKIYLRNAYAAVQVEVSPATDFIKQHEVVPVVVMQAFYPFNGDKIIISATPLVGPKSIDSAAMLVGGQCFEVKASRDNSADRVQTEQDMRTLIAETQKQIALLPEYSVSFFRQLLGGTDASSPASAASEVAVTNLKPGTYKRPENALFDSPMLVSDPDCKDLLTGSDMPLIIMNMYLHNLLALKSLVIAFPTKDAIDAKKRYWK